MLQIQPRRKPPGPDPEWVTAQYVWDDTVHPWHDVAHIVLDEALDYDESMLTAFDLGNHPPCLPVPLGRSHRRPALVERPAARRPTGRCGPACSATGCGAFRPKFGDSRRDPDWIAVPPMPDPP